VNILMILSKLKDKELIIAQSIAYELSKHNISIMLDQTIVDDGCFGDMNVFSELSLDMVDEYDCIVSVGEPNLSLRDSNKYIFSICTQSVISLPLYDFMFTFSDNYCTNITRFCAAMSVSNQFVSYEKILVEVIEYVYSNFLVENRYPNIGKYDYCLYRTTMPLTDTDFKSVLINRLNCIMEKCLAPTCEISLNINWENYYVLQNTFCTIALDEKLRLKEIKSFSKLREFIVKLKCQYVYENIKVLKSNKELSYAYLAMYILGYKNELMGLFQAEQTTHDSLLCLVGLIYQQLGQEDLALMYLKQYLYKSLERKNEIFATDTWEHQYNAFRFILSRLHYETDLDEIFFLAKELEQFIKKYPQKDYSLLPKTLNKVPSMIIDSSEFCEINRILSEQKIGNVKPKKKKLRIKKIKRRIVDINRKIRKKIFITFKQKMKPKLKKYKFLRGFHILWLDFRRAVQIYNKNEEMVLRFKDKHKGKACFVIGNGPSLRADDLERIKKKGYFCFSSNKIYKIFSQTDWRPDYYACIDREVFNQNLYETLSNISCPIFLHHGFHGTVKKYEQIMSTKKDNIFYMRYYCKKKERFYPQAANITSGGTVTFTLLELAWMMGFKTIYLIGCDNTYASFNNVNKMQETITSTETTSKDYFSKDYMRPGEIMRVGDLDKATRGYMVARKYIESHGGKIYNATRGGKLEVFERVDLDELLANVK